MNETGVCGLFDFDCATNVSPEDDLWPDHVVFDFASIPYSTSPIYGINPKRDAACQTNYSVGRTTSNRAGTKRQINKAKSSCAEKDRLRRVNASIRERKRLHVLNDALYRLKSIVPDARTKERATKLDVLRMASRYIFRLGEVLKESTPCNSQIQSEQERGVISNSTHPDPSYSCFKSDYELEKPDALEFPRTSGTSS